MMKKMICAAVCAVMLIACFAGCAVKPLTFREANEAGKAFIKENGLKNITATVDTGADGNISETTVEGTYDPETKSGVFSVSVEKNDTVKTLKDCVRLYGGDIYLKIPELDLSDLGGFLSAVPFGEGYRTDTEPGESAPFDPFENGTGQDRIDMIKEFLSKLGVPDGEIGIYGTDPGKTDPGELFSGIIDYDDISGFICGIDPEAIEKMLEDGIPKESYTPDIISKIHLSNPFSKLSGELSGKFIKLKLPGNKLPALTDILDSAEQTAYEKAEKLEPEENYPYVVKYTKEDARDLVIYVLDAVKAGKDEIIAEIKAAVTECTGEENLKKFEEYSGVSLDGVLSDAMDKFFSETKAEDIASGECGFYCVQKLAYADGRIYDCVTEFSPDGEDKTGVSGAKFRLTVTAAEPDDGFAEKCGVEDGKVFDPAEFSEKIRSEISDRMK